MHWSSWQEFWTMGGSGGFVWGAYGLAALAMACEVAMVRSRARRARDRVRAAAEGAKEPS
jgi:heme exporter protein D